MEDFKKYLKNRINCHQIKALLWKDFLTRIRQPWMTLLQYVWPCAIFLALYILRNRFQSTEIDACQYPSRLLPTKGEILPFFQTYICSIENQCMNTSVYEETTVYQRAPITPVLNILQTIINEDTLFNTLVNLPVEMNFIGAITTITTHPKFSLLEENIRDIGKHISDYSNLIGDKFDINALWSDDMVFSSAGNILCAKPFPRSNSIRYVENIFYTEDYNGPDKQELDVMPTNYCKQLYLDVTNTNHGKITWSIVKPIIQGKILYGPESESINKIMSYANETFDELNKLKTLIGQFDTILTMLRQNGTFRDKFDDLIRLAKTSFVQLIIKNYGIDSTAIDGIFATLVSDETLSTVVRTVNNILECFSVDRFIPVKTESELEEKAYQLNEEKLFYASVFFNKSDPLNEFIYKLRMEIDNSPITIENRNRFWFPGPHGSFEFDMRYHRGFIQIQNAIDRGIIKSKKHQKNVIDQELSDRTSTTTEALQSFNPNNGASEDDDDLFTDYDFDYIDTTFENSTDDKFDSSSTSEPELNGVTTETDVQNSEEQLNGTSTNSPLLEIIYDNLGPNINLTDKDLNKYIKDSGIVIGEGADITDSISIVHTNRTKRAPQFQGMLSFLFGGDSQLKNNLDDFDIDKLKIFTRQFPYPKYIRDDFKQGLYLAQSVQLTFFFALIIQVAKSVHQRIWMKESGNSMLLQIMGMKRSSDYISWVITNKIELAVIFLFCCIILYTGGILQTTSKLFLYFYLLIFGICFISFCYMISAFFSSAVIGSVAAVILFLITFMPYIIIISLGSTLGFGGKFLANLSISTAFCYAWHYIMRNELQQHELSFSNAFTGPLDQNDLKFGIFMIILDTILYILIGYIYERFKYDEWKFRELPVKDMDVTVGAVMKNVSKQYSGMQQAAIKNISIIFRRDFITCLLGRNGVGKSTIIKLLTGQITQNAGEIYLPENLNRLTGDSSKERVGLCPQNNVLFPNLTAKEHLQLYARIKLQDDFETEVKSIIKKLNFQNYVDFKSENLSGGFKRRLNIAIAFIGSPNLVILDEPCSGVDTTARKNIWELIEILRKGRAVILTTHYLDEAEHLSDHILILNDGSIVSEHNPESLRDNFTESFRLKIDLPESIGGNQLKTIEELKTVFDKYSPECNILVSTVNQFYICVPYFNNNNEFANFGPIIGSLEEMQKNNQIKRFTINSKNLQEIFDSINNKSTSIDDTISMRPNGAGTAKLGSTNDSQSQSVDTPSEWKIVKNLFWKRFTHFKRNYKLLLCVLLLPAIFEIIAMGFMTIRPSGDFDNPLTFGRNLYEGSDEFYSIERKSDHNEKVYEKLIDHCKIDSQTNHCNIFNTSKDAFYWLLKTNSDYLENRYGGITINDTSKYVWYDNNGYHSMPIYLNELNNALFRTELNDDQLQIITINHPLILGRSELSTSSILQQVADAGISLILLVAFSLVVAGSSIYLVNERVTGEKLQQKLCGVSFRTYWSVAFFWDLTIYCSALLLAVIIFKFFNISIYTAKDNFDGICLLLFMFGFATIPMVHLAEKLFKDASLANMYIFCINIIIALTTITIIILIDVLDETYESEKIRNFLNRLFLIFPQHALADGLIEICKNHLLANVMERYYINTYKSPISSDLLTPHYCSMLILGIVFMIINYLIESNKIHYWIHKVFSKKDADSQNLTISVEQNGIAVPNNNNNNKYDLYTEKNTLIVNKLCKIYKNKHCALDNVSFNVKRGECFGLLGVNGAGKSTIFSILSGQIFPTSGTVEYAKENSISYCPQTNALDNLLTVQEVINFYGKLKNISDLEKLSVNTLKSFHLEEYKNVLVKNLSGGNRRKLSVAVTCFGNTYIILMDEPTSDMDPITRSLVYKSINELIVNKRSVLLTSHVISEIDKICHRIGVINQGKLLSINTASDLRTLYGNKYIITIFYDKVESLSIERDLKRDLPELQNLINHKRYLQFTIDLTNNQFGGTAVTTIRLSDILTRLYNFTSDRNIVYTISECSLDHVFETSIESQPYQYVNSAFVPTEEFESS